MQAWEEIFCSMLERHTLRIRFPRMPRMKRLFKNECYRALCEIRSVLEDVSLDDENCFMKIERIIRVYEERGVFCGRRHDY